MEQLIDLDLADKNYTGALARVQKQVNASKPSATMMIYRQRFTLSQNDYTTAEKDLLKAIELAPENNRPYI